MKQPTKHQQETLSALYQSIKYCEEEGFKCYDLYFALNYLERELKQQRESN